MGIFFSFFEFSSTLTLKTCWIQIFTNSAQNGLPPFLSGAWLKWISSPCWAYALPASQKEICWDKLVSWKGQSHRSRFFFIQTYPFGVDIIGLLNSDTFYGNHLMAGFLVTRGGGGFNACELTRVSHKNMVQMGTWHLKKHLVSHIRWWQCTSPGLIPEICQHHISIVAKM